MITHTAMRVTMFIVVSVSVCVYYSGRGARSQEVNAAGGRPLGEITDLLKPKVVWKVKSVGWSDADEAGYSDFVRDIGKLVQNSPKEDVADKDKCSIVDDCIWKALLKSKKFEALSRNDQELILNELRKDARKSRAIRFQSDCADFVYVVRALYAWLHDLPFSFVSGVTSRDSGRSGRTSVRGNKITSRVDVLSGPDGPTSDVLLTDILANIRMNVYSAMLRMSATEGSGGSDTTLLPDFYSPAVNRSEIVPGVVVYDPDGHAGIVYDVSKDGKISIIDAHPENFVTTKQISFASRTFDANRMRRAPISGLKKWRPQRVVRESVGGVTSGKIVLLTNEELGEKYSLDQFQGRFDANGDPVNQEAKEVAFYKFLAARLCVAEACADVDKSLALSTIDELCKAARERKTNVDASTDLASIAHPARLPGDIFSTEGDWENFSTPGRDSDFRSMMRNLRTLIHSGEVSSSEVETSRGRARDCKIYYQASNGEPRELTLLQVFAQAYALSFDPYHCIEMRWGESGDRRMTCPKSGARNSEKFEWYEAEQLMREELDREFVKGMGSSLEELKELTKYKREAPDVIDPFQ